MACFSSVWETKSEVELHTLFFEVCIQKEADLKLDQLLHIRLNEV